VSVQFIYLRSVLLDLCRLRTPFFIQLARFSCFASYPRSLLIMVRYHQQVIIALALGTCVGAFAPRMAARKEVTISRMNGEDYNVFASEGAVNGLMKEASAKVESFDDVSLDVSLSELFSSMLNAFLGRSYATTCEALRESKARTEKRMSRSNYESTKAIEKIDRLRRKFELAQKEIEEELKEKLAEQQVKIDEEVEQYTRVLQSEIRLEASRESEIVETINILNEKLSAKMILTAKEDQIFAEMQQVRSKLAPGSIASQLDEMMEQKRRATQIDLDLVANLKASLVDLESVLEAGQRRSALLTSKLLGLAKPKADAAYEWSDFEEIEASLNEAAENMKTAEGCLRKRQERLNEVITMKRKLQIKNIPLGPNTVENKEDKAEYETLGRELAKSVGKAAFGGSKAALFGLKTFIDSVTGGPDERSTAK